MLVKIVIIISLSELWGITLGVPGGSFHGHRNHNNHHQRLTPGSHFNNQRNRFVVNHGRRPSNNFHSGLGRPHQGISPYRHPQPQANVPQIPINPIRFKPGVRPVQHTPAPSVWMVTPTENPSSFLLTGKDKEKPPKVNIIHGDQKVIVDEAGPVQPGPSVWIQESWDDGVTQEVIAADAGQISPEGASEDSERIEEAGSVLPGPSVWVEDGDGAQQVPRPSETKVGSAEGGEDDKESSYEAYPDLDEKSSNNSTNVDQYVEDISDLIDVRGNFG